MLPRVRQTVMFGPPPEPLERRPAWWDIPIPDLGPSELGLERARALYIDFVRRDQRFLDAVTIELPDVVGLAIEALRDLAADTRTELLELEAGTVTPLRLPPLLRRLRERHVAQSRERAAFLQTLADTGELAALLSRERRTPVDEWSIRQALSDTLFRPAQPDDDEDQPPPD